MNKIKSFLMLVIISALLTGCSNTFAKAEYNDIDKIVNIEDRYAKENSNFNPIDNGYSLVIEKFDGRETLWTETVDENKDIDVEVKLSISSGTVKIVHIDDNGNVVTLVECIQGNSDEINIVKTVSLKSGQNRIKIVGYECKNIDLAIVSSDFQ